MRIGEKIINLETCDSTNQVALSEEMQYEPNGTVIISDIQTAGKGRQNRIWQSPPGGLYLSIILDADRQLNEYNKFAIMTALAVRETLGKFAPDSDFRVKWPNDVFYFDRKLSGILVQAKTRGEISRVAVGVGVNLNIDWSQYPEHESTAVSMTRVVGRETDIPRFLNLLLTEIDTSYEVFMAGEFEKLIPRINSVLYSKGRETEINISGEVRKYLVLGVNPDGTLHVQSPETGFLDLNIGEIS